MPHFLLGRGDKGLLGSDPRVEVRVRHCENILGVQWHRRHVDDGDIHRGLVLRADSRMARDNEVWVKLEVYLGWHFRQTITLAHLLRIVLELDAFAVLDSRNETDARRPLS